MRVGISSALFYFHDLLEKLPVFREAGFEAIEICPGSIKDGKVPHYDWRDAAYTEKLASRLGELGIKVESLHAPYSPDLDPAHPDSARRQATLDELRGVAKVLKKLGGRTLVMHIAVNGFALTDKGEFEQRLRNVQEILPPLVEELRSLGLRLALENLLPHLLGGDVETLNRLLSPYSTEDVGICFDTSHANLWHKPPLYGMLEGCVSRLFNLHLSDNRGEFDDHFVPGEGNVDWRRVRDILRNTRYDGLAVFEVFKSGNGLAAEEVAKATFNKAQEFVNG